MFLVIRLKQIEHIRNERNTLAAVAGHPFITTMITSFSDKDSLYMIVRTAHPPLLSLAESLTFSSSIIAPAVKSLRT